MAKAIVIGSTGMVGKELVSLLEADARFDSVTALVRRSGPPRHPKVTEEVVDFRRPETWSGLVRGDVLFSTMGTTLKKAGSQEAQYEVDYTFQLEGARAALRGGVGCFVLVSAMGADAGSMLFYNRMKGELERDVAALGIPRVRILQPGILAGERGESRPLEAAGLRAVRALALLPGLGKYRPIHARVVARAMIASWEDETPGRVVYVGERLFALGGDARHH